MSTREQIAERIREEYTKHPTLDWADIASAKILATMREERQPSQTEDQLLVGMLMDLSSKVAMVGGLGGTRDWIVAELGVIISHVQDAQPSAPTVDVHAIAEDLTAHLAKMSLPTDPYGWKVIVRIALIGRLTKLLTNP